MAAQDIARGRRPAAWHALPVVLAMVGLYAYWFVFAERERVFLYDHLGATPFDAVTSGRYLMAGLVAAGLILGLRAPILWLARRWTGRRGAPCALPAWPSVWRWCAVPIAVGILATTMLWGRPALPLPLALGSMALALAGLALALWASQRAAMDLRGLIWLLVDGAALAPPLLLIRALELPGQGISTPAVARAAAIGGVVAAIVWLAVMSLLRHWRHRPAPAAAELLAAGLVWAYLALPVAHLVFFTPPGYRYITASENFMAANPLLQLASLAAAALLAVAATALRRGGHRSAGG